VSEVVGNDVGNVVDGSCDGVIVGEDVEMQLEDPMAEYVPAGQVDEHEESPATENEFAAQVMQLVDTEAPDVVEYLPAEQTVQPVDPVPDWKRPAVQAAQMTEAEVAAKYPAPQFKQPVEPTTGA
jgi:hypothetical protein